MINKYMKIDEKQKYDYVAILALIFGVSSLFFYEFILPPLLAIIFGVIALTKIKFTKEKGVIISIVSIILGTVYLLMSLFYANIFNSFGKNYLENNNRQNIYADIPEKVDVDFQKVQGDDTDYSFLYLIAAQDGRKGEVNYAVFNSLSKGTERLHYYGEYASSCFETFNDKEKCTPKLNVW